MESTDMSSTPSQYRSVHNDLTGFPLSPDELRTKQIRKIPQYVYDVINRLIESNWNIENEYSDVDKTDILEGIANEGKVTTNEAAKYWPAILFYRDVGWTVIVNGDKYRFYKKV